MFKHLKYDQDVAKTRSSLFELIAKINDQIGDEMKIVSYVLKKLKKWVSKYIKQIFYFIVQNIFFIKQIFLLPSKPYRAIIFYIKHLNFTVNK